VKRRFTFMSKRRGRTTISEADQKSIAQKYLHESIGNLNLAEGYSDLLRGIFAPMFARQPIVSPIDFDQFTNPMWSVYEREMSISAERNKRLKDYADMDEDSIISTALDIYASEACQYSDEHSGTVWVTSQDPMVMEESHRLFQQTEFEDYIEGIARDTARSGDDFVGALYNFRDGVVRLKFVEPDEVTIRTDRYGRLTSYRYQDSKKDIEPWNFVHYKNIGKKQSAKKGGSVYGTALIEPARRIWRQMRLMEDALVIWRMDIGTRRLVFYVDVGNLGQQEAMAAVRDWERSYKKKPYFNPQTGEFISRHSPLALDNHIFWPIRPTSRSRVEYIGGDTNVSAVADVDYFRRKMAAALKIPMAYLGGDEYAAVRTGLAQMDVYFARCVKKLQRSMIRGTLKLLLTHLRLREVPYSQDDVRVNMEPISGIEEMQRIEALTAAVNLAQMMFMTGTAMGIPPNLWVPYILKDILRIADEDIANMPIDMEQIQQVQQLQAGGPGGEGEGGGEEGAPPDKGKERFERQRQDLKLRINEEMQKGEYRNLKQFLATEADTDMGLLVPESDLIPLDGDGRVSREHRSQLRLH
jgi:hypothetical protein